MSDWEDRLQELRSRWALSRDAWGWRLAPWAGVVAAVLLGVAIVLGVYDSIPPLPVAVEPATAAVPGQLLAQATAAVAQKLYDKSGGYLSNDLLPPGLWLDDMPHWEQGVLAEVRVMVHALHEQWGMSRAQYVEDADLASADTAFAVDAYSLWWPRPEAEFSRGVADLQSYQRRLQAHPPQALFLAREQALRQYLETVDDDLGRMSARLNGAVSQVGPGVDGAVAVPAVSWWHIDDNFYDARGRCWALVPMLQALDLEYAATLQQRHADLSMRAAIHELEATQQALWSPMVLNGSGFGIFANHSLTLANYISRAHLDLQDVVAQLNP